jgi:cobalamin synthase
MLLLLNRRYPAVAAVLGAISGVAFIIIGIASNSSALVLFSALSVVLAIVRTAHRHRRAPAGTRA